MQVTGCLAGLEGQEGRLKASIPVCFSKEALRILGEGPEVVESGLLDLEEEVGGRKGQGFLEENLALRSLDTEKSSKGSLRLRGLLEEEELLLETLEVKRIYRR